MLGWLRRALTPAEPSRPRVEARLAELENHFDDIDSRLDYLTSEIKKVRGRQFALEKHAQDDVQPANDEQPAVDQPKRVPNTAFLARRFRGF